jgi:hypothetical protein
VLGSNQRRLSRRFYRTIPLTESYAIDLCLCGVSRGRGPTPSAICPCAPGSGAARSRTGDALRRHRRGRRWRRCAGSAGRPPAGRLGRAGRRPGCCRRTTRARTAGWHGHWKSSGSGGPCASSGSGYADRPPGFLPLTWHSGCLLAAVISLVTGFGLGPAVLSAERIGDPLVRGISLPVDAVRVDLQQDGIEYRVASRGRSHLACPAARTSSLLENQDLRQQMTGLAARTPLPELQDARCERSQPECTSRPVNSTPSHRAPQAAPTSKSPPTCTYRCEPSKAVCSEPTGSSGSPADMSWPMRYVTSRRLPKRPSSRP